MNRYTAPIVVITLLITGIASADWSSDLRLTEDQSQSHLPCIAADLKDNLHIVWIDGRGPGIYYKKIDSSGNVLVQDKKIADMNHFTGDSSVELFSYDRPHICVDPMDNVNIVFDNYNRGCNPRLPPLERVKDITYVKLSSEGKSIISSKILKTGPGIRSTDIGSNSKGDVYIVWEGYSDKQNTTYSENYYTKLDKDGAVLKDSEKLDSGGLGSPDQHEFPRVAIDRLDNVHLIWGNGEASGSIVLDQSDAMIKDQKLGISGLYSDIVADSKDIHAVIANDLTGPTQGLEYIKFDSRGNMLENATRVLAASNGGGMHPQIDAGPTDNVHVAWFQNNSGIYYMLLSNSGEKLIPEAKITDAETASYPDLAVDSKNCVHIVWEDSRDGNSEIYYKYSCPVVPAQGAEDSSAKAEVNNAAPKVSNETAQIEIKEPAAISTVSAMPASSQTAQPAETVQPASNAASVPTVEGDVLTGASTITAVPDLSNAASRTVSEPAHATEDKASFPAPSDLNKGSPAVTRVSPPVANKLKSWVDSQKGASKVADDSIIADQAESAIVPAIRADETADPDKNSISIQMGKSNASAIGTQSNAFGSQALAANNIEIKNNQDSGECTPCQDNCQDACIRDDLEMISIRDRSSSAWGSSDATNNVRIVSNQD